MKYYFLTTAFALASTIFAGKLYVFDKKNTTFVANYSVFVTILILFYSLFALLLLRYGGFVDKIFLTLFALSPFIIGKFVSYKLINLFTYIQFIIILLSMVFVVRLQFTN